MKRREPNQIISSKKSKEKVTKEITTKARFLSLHFTRKFNRSLFLSVLVSLFFFLQFHKFFNFFRDDNDISKYNYNMVSTDHFGDILLFGQSLYNYNLVIVLLSGLLLLVAMVGAIVLTLDFRATNFIELSERQLARSANTLKLYK